MDLLIWHHFKSCHSLNCFDFLNSIDIASKRELGVAALKDAKELKMDHLSSYLGSLENWEQFISASNLYS